MGEADAAAAAFSPMSDFASSAAASAAAALAENVFVSASALVSRSRYCFAFRVACSCEMDAPSPPVFPLYPGVAAAVLNSAMLAWSFCRISCSFAFISAAFAETLAKTASGPIMFALSFSPKSTSPACFSSEMICSTWLRARSRLSAPVT